MESRILQLVAALRAGGVRISLAESAEAFSAVELMGVQDREHFRLSLRATLIKNVRDLPIFDKLFPLFFGSSEPPVMGGNASEQLTPEEARMVAQALRGFAESLRQRIERFMSGEPLSPEELESLGQLIGMTQARDVRYQSWMAQRMLRALAFPEVRAALEELLSQLAEMGMDRDRVAGLKDLIQENLRGIGEQIRRYAGQRLAETMSERPESDGIEGLMNRPFEALSDNDKKLLQRQVRRLAAALRTRIALRQKRAKSGDLDLKSTIRVNLRYQGVPDELRHRNRTRKPKLVLLCDVSTSMRFCAQLMLSLLFELQGQVHKTQAFAYIDHLEYISGDYTGSDADRAVASVLERMPSGHYNTDLGWSLNDFSSRYMDTLSSGTTLIILGDGRNNYNDPRLDLFAMMARRVARTIWLNPEPAFLWHGDSDMPKYAPLCSNVLRVANLQELTLAVDQLLEG